MSADTPQSAGTYWIASYPKSGNTWLRLFLKTYYDNPKTPLSINSLPSGSTAYLRRHFDELLGLETADFPPELLSNLRPRCYDLMAQGDNFSFVKTHECFTRTASGEPVFSAASSAGAIVIVRHPFDVAVSLSHFLRISVDDAITRMAGPDADAGARTLTEAIPHETGSWSSFAHSWINGSLPFHQLRYEDMLDHPEATFSGVLKFLNAPHDTARLRKSIAFTSFDGLKKQEAQNGFAAMQTGASAFFRAGKKNNWQHQLSSKQRDRLQRDHFDMMTRFHYLP